MFSEVTDRKTIIFVENAAKIHNKRKNLIATARKERRLYKIKYDGKECYNTEKNDKITQKERYHRIVM